MQYALKHCKQIATESSVTFTGPCVVTGETHSVTVPADGIKRYEKGAMIQDAFPYLSVNEREFLKTGISSEGWNKTFADAEEDSGEEVDAIIYEPFHEPF